MHLHAFTFFGIQEKVTAMVYKTDYKENYSWYPSFNLWSPSKWYICHYNTYILIKWVQITYGLNLTEFNIKHKGNSNKQQAILWIYRQQAWFLICFKLLNFYIKNILVNFIQTKYRFKNQLRGRHLNWKVVYYTNTLIFTLVESILSFCEFAVK